MLLMIAVILGISICSLLHANLPLPSPSYRTNTWSVVAADPDTGDVGVAVASCVPRHVDHAAALVPGKGAAATQAYWQLRNRNTVYRLLQEGRSAKEIIEYISAPNYDEGGQGWEGLGVRQYGIVTLNSGKAEVATFTGDLLDSWGGWSGDQHDINMSVTVQGNVLAGSRVVAEAMRAFRADDTKGRNSLPDRLMRALEAGSEAGGDMRCNNDDVTQTATSASILVARAGDPPYAAKDIGVSDAGKPTAPWLALSVLKPKFGANPVHELRQRYDAWAKANAPREE